MAGYKEARAAVRRDSQLSIKVCGFEILDSWLLVGAKPDGERDRQLSIEVCGCEFWIAGYWSARLWMRGGIAGYCRVSVGCLSG
jgi:hypothetical protein